MHPRYLQSSEGVINEGISDYVGEIQEHMMDSFLLEDFDYLDYYDPVDDPLWFGILKPSSYYDELLYCEY